MEASEEERQRLPQDGEPSIEVQPTEGSWIRRRWVWLVLLGLAVAILAIVSVIMIRPGSGSNAGGDGAIGRTASDHSPGSEVTLYLPGRASVMVAVDEKAFDELIGAISRRGGEEQTLIQSGKVFIVPNNTRARIMESSSTKLRVRILEGDKIMFEVWVPERWVR